MKKRCFPVTDVKMKKDRWNQYYSDFDMSQYLALLSYDEITDALDTCVKDMPKDIKVLDVGCGPGRHLVHLYNKGFIELTGIDLSKEGIDRLKEYNSIIKAEVGDATKLPYGDNTFDLIVMVGIVYEIEDAELHKQVFAEIKRVLKKDGVCFFANNSPYNLGERIYTFTSFYSDLFNRAEKDFFVWRYSTSDVKGLIEKAGLSLEAEIPCNHRRGIYRFLYGIFVKNESLRQRNDFLARTNGNSYRIHEYYTVNKDTSLLNWAGRIVDKLCVFKFFKMLFGNTIVFVLKK